ncbi:class I SAM-dependent methyltransferase [Poseidonibacter lekithochrous]|uniref:class I SAM-dependent methyltransferase n=1 Tax=Poseidonibacter lekithochrous TaxID=1904463 RepID=UPI0008FC76F5|nr:methyltransferase domain-containing protein [Poseidonibacter lekithochrous]QKJ22702.1 methyltransferase [Poseidonibacter lekithochrous]
MKKFTNESMYEIIDYMEEKLKIDDLLSIEVLNPDLGINNYAGEIVDLDEEYTYHSYKAWNDLAELMFCKLLTPLKVSEYTVNLKFKKINRSDSFHKTINSSDNEKYGEESIFFRINKNEEPAFLYYYKQALANVKIQTRNSVLNLGINKADEFQTIKDCLDEDEFLKKDFVGIDFCPSAIEFAKNRFPTNNFSFFTHDINKLDELNLKKFDLIISIGTLQSSSLNFKEAFMSLIQNYLDENGSIILGFPNCRWIDTEMIYGAKAPNYSFSEQSILYKDVYFCKKYLQQKKFRVTLTGKNYLFLTATSIKK